MMRATASRIWPRAGSWFSHQLITCPALLQQPGATSFTSRLQSEHARRLPAPGKIGLSGGTIPRCLHTARPSVECGMSVSHESVGKGHSLAWPLPSLTQSGQAGDPCALPNLFHSDHYFAGSSRSPVACLADTLRNGFKKVRPIPGVLTRFPGIPRLNRLPFSSHDTL